jgi:hypothetical protein
MHVIKKCANHIVGSKDELGRRLPEYAALGSDLTHRATGCGKFHHHLDPGGDRRRWLLPK